MERITIEFEAPPEVIKAARELIMAKPDNGACKAISDLDWTLRETTGNARRAWEANAFGAPEAALAFLIASAIDAGNAGKMMIGK